MKPNQGFDGSDQRIRKISWLGTRMNLEPMSVDCCSTKNNSLTVLNFIVLHLTQLDSKGIATWSGLTIAAE